MKIPNKKVKIGAYDYNIKMVDKLEHEGKSLWGLCDRENCVLLLQKGMGEDRLMEVFLHECLHAIEEVYSIKLGEQRVEKLGMALLAFFKDNRISFNKNKVKK